MKSMKNFHAVAMTVCALMCLSVTASHAAVVLLEPSSELSRAGQADSVMSAINSELGVDGVQAVRVNASVVSENSEVLMLNFGGKAIYPAHKQQAYYSDIGNLIWMGSIDTGLYDDSKSGAEGSSSSSNEVADKNPQSTIAMVISPAGLVDATIALEGDRYSLRSLKTGEHVLVKLNDQKVQPDHPLDMISGAQEQLDLSLDGEVSSRPGEIQAVTTIRVLVMYTSRAAAATSNIGSLIDLAFAEANQGYANSGVEINLVKAGTMSTTYVESSSMSTDLTRFRGTTDGYMDNVHATRNSTTADVVMLLIETSASCGLASGIGSTASTAFAVTARNCATGYYSFAHEIGHLQSARHDPAADPTTTPYAYGHGYRYQTGGWRTIMAYACSGTPSCTRINYWSSPLKTYNGVKMGNTTQSDNARVLNLTKATIAGFR